MDWYMPHWINAYVSSSLNSFWQNRFYKWLSFACSCDVFLSIKSIAIFGTACKCKSHGDHPQEKYAGAVLDPPNALWDVNNNFNYKDWQCAIRNRANFMRGEVATVIDKQIIIKNHKLLLEMLI